MGNGWTRERPPKQPQTDVGGSERFAASPPMNLFESLYVIGRAPQRKNNVRLHLFVLTLRQFLFKVRV